MTNKNLWLWFDPTNYCNLSCDLCYTKTSHGQVFLEPQLFKFMLEKVVASGYTVKALHLNWRGEPLLNKNFEELLALVGRFELNTDIHWHSNGTLITKRRAEGLLNVPIAGKQKIYISIDGGTEESHDANRGKGTFRKALQGLENLLDARHSNSNQICLGIYQLNLDVNIADYDTKFMTLAQLVDEWVRVNPVLNRGSEIGMDDKNSDKACFWSGNSMFVSPTGDVSICALSERDTGIVGNLVDDDIHKIVENATAWREKLDSKGRKSVTHCCDCKKKNGHAYDADVSPPKVSKWTNSIPIFQV